MSTLTARGIFDRVRGIINRIPVTIVPNVGGIVEDENTNTSYNPVNAGSGTVADEYLLTHLNTIVRYICSACKSFHTSTNVEEADTATGPTLVDDQVRGRVVHGTVRRNNGTEEVRARFRELGEHYDLQSSGREATEVYPAYTYLDHDVTIYPTPTTGSVAKYVVSPSGITVNNMVGLTDVLAVDNRFEGAIVAYVAAKAFQQIEEGELHNLWLTLFTRKIEPFLSGTRIGDPSTHLVSAISYERENEIE